MSEKSNMSRRSFLKATGGTASAVALTGTAVGQETTTEGTESGQGTETGQEGGGGGTLSLIARTMSTMDPIKSTDTESGRVIQQVFDGLMNYPDGEIEVESLLAQDYQTSDDNRTWTFNLKQGAQFHGDYGEVTAQDFVYSWERLAASEESRRSSFILNSIGIQHETDGEGNYQPGTLAINAVDDYTLEFTVSEPFHATLELLAYTSFAAVPEGIVGDIEGYEGDMEYQEFSTSNPMGAGPFQFEMWQSNDQAEVSRFDDYHGQVASVDGVNWRIIENDNAHFTYAMNRNADRFEIPTQFYDPNKLSVDNTDDLGRETGTYGPVRNDATLDYVGVPTINASYLGFNTAQIEKPVRQAIAYALNQQTAVEQVLKGRGEPGYHFTPPNIYPGGREQYDQHAQENYPYGYNQAQLQQAQQVIEEAGYGSNNPYEFTMTTYESEVWQQIAQILRDQLASINVNMTIESAPFSTLIQRGRNGELQAYTLGWIMDWPAPDNFLELLYPPQTDTSQSSPLSYVNWSDTEAAQQATQAWEQIQNNAGPTDEARQARNEAYVQIEEANWEDVVFLPVYHEHSQMFSYDNVDIPIFGGAGDSRQKFNTATKQSSNN